MEEEESHANFFDLFQHIYSTYLLAYAMRASFINPSLSDWKAAVRVLFISGRTQSSFNNSDSN